MKYIFKGNSKPSQLGLFIILHSRALMIDVILALYGCKNSEKFYSDTDSIYIHDYEFEILKLKKLIGKNLYQSKKDYGKGGILYGLILATKIK